MKLPLVTVGVASFNNAAYLRETLESIRLQTYSHVELLIVDDASRDDSVAVAEAWLAEHPDVNGRLIRHATNLGVCRVCNDVVTQAQGEFICIIGSDDVYLPDKLAQQVPLLLNATPNIGVVFGDIVRMDSAGNPLDAPADLSPTHSGDVFLPLLQVNFVSAMSALVRRSCYDTVGLYDETLAYEDWDMWLRIAREYHFLHAPQLIARYRIHSGSATFNRRVQIAESSLKLLHKHQSYSPTGDRLIAAHTRQNAEWLYQLGSPCARQWLWKVVKQTPDATSAGLLVLAVLGIPAGQLGRLKGWAKGLLTGKLN